MDKIQGMGALRWEKPLEGPQLFLIMPQALHSVWPAPSWAILTSFLPPAPTGSPFGPRGPRSP